MGWVNRYREGNRWQKYQYKCAQKITCTVGKDIVDLGEIHEFAGKI